VIRAVGVPLIPVGDVRLVGGDWPEAASARSYNGVDSVVTRTASAWAASTWWSAAVVLAVAGAGLWFLLDWVVRDRGGLLRALRSASPVMVG